MKVMFCAMVVSEAAVWGAKVEVTDSPGTYSRIKPGAVWSYSFHSRSAVASYRCSCQREHSGRRGFVALNCTNAVAFLLPQSQSRIVQMLVYSQSRFSQEIYHSLSTPWLNT
ncbi:hypothetical protein BDN72DRAFT_280657 [Pluteus cervinus]|uniref:Uncharacterized protein n=1 Tax=Pluteus cervinus TaxID=181527 RepID=A0ACD3AEJ7_9AGAR|nr:hypothetical protein BDN72DRAFT_280657 [Pluteus cervinus]